MHTDLYIKENTCAEYRCVLFLSLGWRSAHNERTVADRKSHKKLKSQERNVGVKKLIPKRTTSLSTFYMSYGNGRSEIVYRFPINL